MDFKNKYTDNFKNACKNVYSLNYKKGARIAYNKLRDSYTQGKALLSRGKNEVLVGLNSGRIKSQTNYFIYVDLKNFMTYVYKKNKSWSLIKSYICTIGKPFTPTVKGNYKVGVRGEYFGVNRGYKCLYYTQIKDNYLFHSIIYNLDGTVRDARMGMALTDGCVRLETVNAKWIWDNVPRNSGILIE